MAEVLSEIKIGARIIEPIAKVLKKKPEMLEEQIRDIAPIEFEEETDETLCAAIMDIYKIDDLTLGTEKGNSV